LAQFHPSSLLPSTSIHPSLHFILPIRLCKFGADSTKGEGGD
jgi:hypothetical protein